MAACSRPYKKWMGATCMCNVECMIIGSYGDELPSRLGAVPMKAARFIRESSFLHGVHEDFREIQDKIRSDPSKELVYAYPVFPGIRKGTSELQPRAECIEKIEQLLKKCRQNGGEPKQIAMCMNKTLNKEYSLNYCHTILYTKCQSTS